MSKSPTQRRLCNPGQVPDARYFGDRKTRLKRTRTEPLPGTKTPMPSTNDGGLSELIVAKVGQTRTCPTGKALGWMAAGFAALLLVFSYAALFVQLPEIVMLIYYVVFVFMHFCVLCSHLMSDKRISLGLVSLAIYYLGLILWFIIVSLTSAAG